MWCAAPFSHLTGYAENLYITVSRVAHLAVRIGHLKITISMGTWHYETVYHPTDPRHYHIIDDPQISIANVEQLLERRSDGLVVAFCNRSYH